MLARALRCRSQSSCLRIQLVKMHCSSVLPLSSFALCPNPCPVFIRFPHGGRKLIHFPVTSTVPFLLLFRKCNTVGAISKGRCPTALPSSFTATANLCGCHPEDIKDSFSNIKVVFLPANATSMLQPLDLGIFKSFKVHFYTHPLRFVISLKLVQLHHR